MSAPKNAILVDSSGWLHYFGNGSLVERYADIVKKLSTIVTPSIVVYEVYKKLKNDVDAEIADNAAQAMQKTHVVDLTMDLACLAADMALEYKLAMADAIIYATAKQYEVPLYTSDKDFEKLPGVKYIPADPA